MVAPTICRFVCGMDKSIPYNVSIFLCVGQGLGLAAKLQNGGGSKPPPYDISMFLCRERIYAFRFIIYFLFFFIYYLKRNGLPQAFRLRNDISV